MQNKKAELLAEVADYYSGKLAQFGDTPRGVDWNGEESQFTRFEQLCKVIESADGVTVNDLGCGYGALFEYLECRFPNVSYLGVDVSKDMTASAVRRIGPHPRARFVTASAPDQEADYGIASGIFNVRLEHGIEEWGEYLASTLDTLDRTSRKGFAFNCLTSYSDADKLKDYLYYADPCFIFDLCKRRYSRQVALLHDYGLYEFTILVRKPQ